MRFSWKKKFCERVRSCHALRSRSYGWGVAALPRAAGIAAAWRCCTRRSCGGGQHKEGGGVRPWSKMCAAAARRAGQSQGAPGRRRPPPAHLDPHDWARRAGGGCVECLPGVALTLCRPCADSMRVFGFSQLEYTTPRQNGKFAGQGYFLPVSQLCSVLTRASAAGFRVYGLM